jgi:hypothetical protein
MERYIKSNLLRKLAHLIIDASPMTGHLKAAEPWKSASMTQ